MKQEVKPGPFRGAKASLSREICCSTATEWAVTTHSKVFYQLKRADVWSDSPIDPGRLCLHYQPETFSFSTRSRLKACMKTFCMNVKYYTESAVAVYDLNGIFAVLKVLCSSSRPQEMWVVS